MRSHIWSALGFAAMGLVFSACHHGPRPAAAPAAPADGPLAVVASITGDGKILQADGAVETSPFLATLAPGDRLELQPGGRATLICRGDRLVRLRRSRVVDVAGCARGALLPAGTFLAVVPRNGRLQPVPGSSVLPPVDRDLRREYGRLPVVLSPRSTALSDRRPTIRWTEVPEADLYLVAWDGPGWPSAALEPQDLRCVPDVAFGADVVSCALPWPADWPELAPAAPYFLQVQARLKEENEPRRSREVNKIRILSLAEAERLRHTVTDIDAIPRVDELVRHIVRGGVFLSYGVFSEAIAAYRRAAELRPSAKTLNTLGDAYCRVRLFFFARDAYRRAAGHAESEAERAAAESGLGHVAYSWRRFGDAWRHFQRAEEHYRNAGLRSEAARVAEARSDTEQRLPRHLRVEGRP